MLCACVVDVMDVVFSVCIVGRGAVLLLLSSIYIAVCARAWDV